VIQIKDLGEKDHLVSHARPGVGN